MRIAILSNAYPPNMRGGGGRMTAWHEEMLVNAGHDVRVWHPAISWFQQPALVRLFHHLFDLLPKKSIIQDICAWKPDVLVSENLTGCGFATPQAVKKLQSVKWVHILHDVQLFEPSGRLKEERFTFWQKSWSFLRRAVFGIPDLVISPTAWLLALHQQRGWFAQSKTVILPNPAPEEQFVLRSPQQPLKLLLVSATKEKGADFIANVVKELASVELTITYPAHEPQRDFALQNVKTIPNHGPQEVLEMMKEHDVLVVPSIIAENQPTVIGEAASVGMPVIASRIGGMSEFLTKAGILCDVRQSSSWKEAILSLQDPSRYSVEATKMYELARTLKISTYARMFTRIIEDEAAL